MTSFRIFVLSCTVVALAAVGGAQVNVTTWHYDVGRTGQNNAETTLTTTLVSNPQTFGKICGLTLDGKVFAQTLVVSNVPWQGGAAKTIAYVVTQNDSVYAIDATNPTACNVLAGPVSMLVNAAEGEIAAQCNSIGGGGCQTITNNVGILGTPVIDSTTGTLYLVAESECPSASACAQNSQNTFFHRLHALDITTLSITPEKFNAPVQICATGCGPDATGSVFSQNHIQRPGLLWLSASQSGLPNNTVYAAFSLMDGAPTPYPNGWIFAYNAGNLSQAPIAYDTTPDTGAEGGGIWQGGAGLAAGADSSGKTFIYFSTADGTFDLSTKGGKDAGDSFVKLTTSLTFPSGQNYFSPSDQCFRQSDDLDFGSGGVVLIPDNTVKAYPYLAIKTDKENYVWAFDRTKPGGFNPGSCVQVSGCPVGGVPACPATNWHNQNLASFNFATEDQTRATPIYWSGNQSFYLVGTYTPMYRYALSGCSSKGCTVSATTSLSLGFSTTPSVSASYQNKQYTNGIVWAIKNPSDPPSSAPQGILYAFDANTLAQLYSSGTCPTMDAPGGATKFSTPVVANGYVFVGGEEIVNGTQDNNGTFAIFGPLSRTTCK
ncbi:MAG: hypothetical protein ABSE92_16080 [Terriglobales bacterium]|jgi:hypothetical protein